MSPVSSYIRKNRLIFLTFFGSPVVLFQCVVCLYVPFVSSHRVVCFCLLFFSLSLWQYRGRRLVVRCDTEVADGAESPLFQVEHCGQVRVFVISVCANDLYHGASLCVRDLCLF